uniref:Porin n=1 Tax=Xanthomonas campestris pv. juglandis TaxID=195709 RepID=A5A8S1_XANCJ|nr:porin [Xanthomonas arboricola pv. juglandis]
MHRLSFLPRRNALGYALLLALPATAVAAGDTTLTGDWGGRRSAWTEQGVSVRGDYLSETFGVVDGGYENTSARYAQQLRVGVDLDMAKLAGWGGGSLHVTINDRRGRSTSADLVGNRFPIQEVYGGQYTRLSEFSYDRSFNQGKTYLKLGFYAMGNQFASHTLLVNFVNAAFCAHPLAFSANSGWYNYPAARWGIEGAQQLTPQLNLHAGWFQVNPNLGFGARDTYAFEPFASGTTGAIFPLEFTWKPATARYPGRVQVRRLLRLLVGTRRGLDTSRSTGRDGAYLLVEQKLFTPGADPSIGLTGFAQYMASDHDSALMTRWYSVGGVYQGIGTRTQDRIALGYVAGRINHRLLDARRAELIDAGVSADSPLVGLSAAEELYELAYSAQITPWLMLRPDLQYIVNPGTYAYTHTRNAVVVGLQAKLTF